MSKEICGFGQDGNCSNEAVYFTPMEWDTAHGYQYSICKECYENNFFQTLKAVCENYDKGDKIIKRDIIQWLMNPTLIRKYVDKINTKDTLENTIKKYEENGEEVRGVYPDHAECYWKNETQNLNDKLNLVQCSDGFFYVLDKEVK